MKLATRNSTMNPSAPAPIRPSLAPVDNPRGSGSPQRLRSGTPEVAAPARNGEPHSGQDASSRSTRTPHLLHGQAARGRPSSSKPTDDVAGARANPEVGSAAPANVASGAVSGSGAGSA